ncbi:MAG: hypothetical protein R3E65_10335 [Steroidobacteraceae bacterium]
MTPTGHDDEFELRLRRGERFVPQFDADLDGPDDAVDRAVLARARATVLQPPVAEPRYHRAPRWTLPLALAATVLLSFTLVMQMDSRDVIAQRTAERADDATRAADAELPAGVAEPAMQPEAEVLVQPPAEAAPMASAPAPVASTSVAAATAGAADTAPRAAQPPAPAPPPPPVASEAPLVDAAAPAPAPASAKSLAAGAMRREAMDERMMARAADAPEPPEAWLARIEALRAGGDLAAARRELEAFRRQHPDTELPAALRPLLEP